MPESELAQPKHKRGAGLIPFAVSGNQVFFLFQTVFSGRKTGFLIDFGGGVGADEDFRQAAVREFVEETETMYFADDLSRARRDPETVGDQVAIVDTLFAQTRATGPDWWCRRLFPDPGNTKRWKTFFVEFPFRDVEEMNRAWETDRTGRFKKRRELQWISAEDLLAIFASAPERLWTRVRQLENAPQVIEAIRRSR